jgi:glycosyltransferase involved in cell wall biosynthesis
VKLAVFKDHGVGRYFAQLFDGIPDTVFYLSDKNKSGLDVTPHEKVVLTEASQRGHVLRTPLAAYRRLKENDFDRKRDFYYFELDEAVARGDFDVALTGSERSLYTLASLKAKGAKFKLVYWIPFTIPFVDMFAERSFVIRQFAFPWVDKFIAITDTCRRTLELEGIDASRIAHIYPGIDLAAFQPRPRPPVAERFHVLFVGKLTSWKGCYSLIYAARRLRDRIPGLQVTLVGQGAQRRHLEEAARLLGVADRIAFKGFVPYEDMPAFYGDADVFVLPSLPAVNLAEQFGFVVAEAMACGLPAVVSRVGGLPEVVGGHPELLFTPGDDGELAERLWALYSDPALRARLATQCLERARAEYDATRNGERLRQCLGSL